MNKEKYKGFELIFNEDGTVETNISVPIIGTLTTVHKTEKEAKDYIDKN